MVRGVPEIERKFKVEALPESWPVPGSTIRQGYLSVEPVEIRIRAEDDARELTVKSLGGLSRVEVGLPLTAEQFDELWPLVIASLEKARHRVELDGAVAEVDVYGGKLDGLVVAEVEFSSEEDAVGFAPPDWFGDEITEDSRFRNAALAQAESRPG
jgi:CYTH domain-containing protein